MRSSLARTVGGKRVVHALAAAALGLLSAVAHAAGDPREVFDKIDPYTRGDRESMEKAGYVSFGPFPWCEGVTTTDITKALNDVPILFVETAHFRIASTLETYRVAGDQIERKKIEGEIARLKQQLDHLPGLGTRLDPWLRLHVYALRLEELYAGFQKSFGLTDGDFGQHVDALAPGLYLGMPLKFTVLLCSRHEDVELFARVVLKHATPEIPRERLPGDSLFLATSVELMHRYGYELDATLHAQVASDVVLNFADGFCNSTTGPPVWLAHGLAFAASRAADERYTVYAGKARRTDEETTRWEPRVHALVLGNYAPSFREMAAWTKFEDMDDRGQLSAWSHVSWLLTSDARKLRKLLLALTASTSSMSLAEQSAWIRDRQLPALEEALGRKVDALEEAWKQHVLKKYPKK